MFKVVIALEEVGRKESLVEACQLFIQKVQEMIKNGGCSAMVLYETCMIKGEIDGKEGMMNFDAIARFSLSVGILDEKGHLSERPLPYIPKDFAQKAFLLNDEDSWNAYIAENAETLAQIIATGLVQEHEPEPKPLIVVAAR